jgi:hypothetical protein
MDFDIKAHNIIFVIFQMKLFFQQFFKFQHTYVHLNKNLVQMFFTKSHLFNFSIVIEMVKSIHIQYITKYFIKFCNYLNHYINMHFPIYCGNIYFFINILFNHLIFFKQCSFLWQLHYLTIELPYFECNVWKSLLILAWWKLKVA